VDMNLYALEKVAKARLDQLRLDAARHAALDSLSERGSWRRTAFGSVLLRAGRLVGRQGIARPRHA